MIHFKTYKRIRSNSLFKRKMVKRGNRNFFSLLPHQKEIFSAIQDYYRYNDKGKLIIPCGSGKSYIILFYIKYNDIKNSLIIVTSINLIKQFKEICEKYLPYHQVVEFYGENKIVNTNNNFRKIFITTYNSANCLKKINFEYVFYDESHRTVVNKKDEESSVFRETVELFKNSKKLFCTATEKIKISKSDNIKYSMNNRDIYGDTIYFMNFREAMNKDIICDYDIILALDDEKEENNFNDTESFCFNQASVIINIFKKFEIKKLLVFCTNIKNADLILRSINCLDTDFSSYNINGNLSEKEQEMMINKFKSDDRALLLNCKFFGEGISINDIDSVYFTSNKTSKIEIIQNIGRAIRKNNKTPDKKAKIFICKDMIYSLDFFQTLIEVDSDLKNVWSKKIKYYSENIDVEKIKSKIEECENKIKFIFLKKNSDSFDEKMKLLKEYEENFGPVKQKEIYKDQNIGIFFCKLWEKYNRGVLHERQSDILKSTLSFKKFSAISSNRKEFEDYMKLVFEFEAEFESEVVISTIYKNVNIGNFFARIKKNYKKGVLTPNEIERINFSRSFSKWIKLKSVKKDEDKKFEKLVEYEKNGVKKIGYLLENFVEKIKKSYINGKLTPEEMEKYLKNSYIKRAISNYQRRSDGLENDLEILLEYEKINSKEILPDFIFNGKNVHNIFERIKKYYKNDKNFEKYQVSVFFKRWYEKKGKFSNFKFNKKMEIVKEFEDKNDTTWSIERLSSEDDRKVYEFLRRAFRKYSLSVLSEDKIPILLTSKTINKWISEKCFEIKKKKVRDLDTFVNRVKLIMEYVNGGNIIRKGTVYCDEKIGQHYYNYLYCYKHGRMSKERIGIVKNYNLF